MKIELGQVVLPEWDENFYFQAEGDHTMLRVARRRPRRHTEPMNEVEARLPSPPFFRIPGSCQVNTDRVHDHGPDNPKNSKG